MPGTNVLHRNGIPSKEQSRCNELLTRGTPDVGGAAENQGEPGWEATEKTKRDLAWEWGRQDTGEPGVGRPPRTMGDLAFGERKAEN